MRPFEPTVCSLKSFEAFQQAVEHLNAPDGLLKGAVGIATHFMPGASFEGVDGEIQGYADDIRKRVKGPQSQALMAHMHRFLFEELGFRGNTEDLANPLNSLVPFVLKERKGSVLSLSVVYKTLAERLGFRSYAVSFSEVLLVAVREKSAPVSFVDVFNKGQIFSRDEVREVYESSDHEIGWKEDMLSPISNRYWLTITLQVLLNKYGSGKKYEHVGALLEMEMLLWPDQIELQRDLVLVLARCERTQAAVKWLTSYIEGNPEDPQKSDLEELLRVLKS